MSHLVCSQIKITDLDILRRAVESFGGLVWKEGQQKFKWYYEKWPIKDGMTKEEIASIEKRNKQIDEMQAVHGGNCDHAIGYTTSTGKGNYEIGVVRSKDGEGWQLLFDPYDSRLAEKVGTTCEKLMAAYSEEYIRDYAIKNGFMIQQGTDDEGNICLTLTK